MASASKETRARVSRAGGSATQRRLAKGDARAWIGRDDERMKLMRWLDDLGWSYAGIARVVCLSRQRVQQLLGES
jgi:hypothetical protein